MQTLNVGAGRTDQEYTGDEEQRRAELRSDSRNDANYFFVAAGLAALATGILPIRVGVLISVGLVDLLTLYGGRLGPFYGAAIYGFAVLWLLALVGLGFAARSGYRWAFVAGIVLYVTDMIALMMMFSIWAFGVHAFFVFRWFQGQKALSEMEQPGATR